MYNWHVFELFKVQTTYNKHEYTVCTVRFLKSFMTGQFTELPY